MSREVSPSAVPPVAATPSPKTDVAGSSPKSFSHSSPHAQVIEVGGDLAVDDDADPTLGDEDDSTASISSSILDYRTEHGRRYHADTGDANYWAPNDEPQNEWLDVNHHVWTRMLQGNLFLAPLPQTIQRVLDVGTGTGLWAIDFADEFPQAEVIGTDVSPIQPSWVPPNLKFEIEDCTQDWTFAPNSFDYVHFRYLIGSIKDWNALFKEAFRVCKPGAWVESYEGSPNVESDDNTVAEDSALGTWGKIFVQAGKTLDRPFTILEDDLQRKGMEEAGFIDIRTTDFKVPIGPWPKDPDLRETGQFARAGLLLDPEGLVLSTARLAWGWSKEQVTVYCAKLRQEVRSSKHHPYYRLRAVYGQKPGTP